MKKSEKLKNHLLGTQVDHIDYGENVSGTQSLGVGMGVRDVARNPKFVSQFDINITPVYSEFAIETDTGTGGEAFTAISQLNEITADDLPAALKNDLPFFIFGNSDFQSGYKNGIQQLPISNWVYGIPKIIKSSRVESHQVTDADSGVNDMALFVESLAVQNGKAIQGDIVIPLFYKGSPYRMAEIVINCKQVGYSTLLAALSSDRFKINMVRYKIPDVTKTNQYEKNLQLLRQSLFGKITTDFVSPAAYQNPEQFQQGIVDIPLVKGMDKESAILSYLNYDVGEILLSFYVETQDKLVQSI